MARTSPDYESLNASQEFSEKDPFTVERYQQFFKFFPRKSKSVLDVGCNVGKGGEVLKRLNSDLMLVGLDCVASRLERLPENVYSQTILGSTTAIDTPDNNFDVICAGEFIEHLDSADVMQTLKEFKRVLRSEGLLLLTTPNPNYLRLKLTGRSVLGGAHLSQHRVQDLSRRLNEVGFTDLKVKGSGKVTRYLGENFPVLCFYGSYLMIAKKNGKHSEHGC